jgi:diadenosine tetraphosphate (Ap4A) HIT family hydrolase
MHFNKRISPVSLLNKKIKHMYIFLDINDVTELTTIIDPKKTISAVTTG